jgi:hypothetical protein
VCSGVSPNLFLAFTLILARGLAAVEQEDDGTWLAPPADRPLPEDFRWFSLALSQLVAEGGDVPTFDPWSETSTSTLTKFTIRSLTKIKNRDCHETCSFDYFILMPLAIIGYFFERLMQASSKQESYVLFFLFLS